MDFWGHPLLNTEILQICFSWLFCTNHHGIYGSTNSRSQRQRSKEGPTVNKCSLFSKATQMLLWILPYSLYLLFQAHHPACKLSRNRASSCSSPVHLPKHGDQVPSENSVIYRTDQSRHRMFSSIWNSDEWQIYFIISNVWDILILYIYGIYIL